MIIKLASSAYQTTDRSTVVQKKSLSRKFKLFTMISALSGFVFCFFLSTPINGGSDLVSGYVPATDSERPPVKNSTIAS